MKIKENIYFVGANYKKRKYFDELIPLRFRTTYNSYLVVRLEKTALIDIVDTSKAKILLQNLNKLKIKKIHHHISNHVEQYQSDSILKKKRMKKAINYAFLDKIVERTTI